MAPSHRVLAVRRRVEHLDAPVWVERVKKLDEHVVDDPILVAVKHRETDQVDVAE